jgi:hypothetical protein
MRHLHALVAPLAVCALLLAAGSSAATSGETKITDQTYVRHDGGTDASIASCNDDTPGTAAAGERQQNEPSAAVDPSNPDHMVAGANDYCNVPTGGDAWAGLYYMPQYEQFGNRDIPFFGDYNYISAVGSTVLLDWTNTRDTVPGTDPWYTNGDGTDGFDVLQCRTEISPEVWSADTCPNAGGLDQNIYGAVVTP